ncbi:PH domain-containing protein [Actinomadura sp. 9N407]|uniref:PH domain-containing protein n=1 Tax=Actinomadura sp. 9N407 TaxID=3375154 RepID=UPI0037BCA96D
MTPLLTIRSTAARVGAWAWLAFATLNLIDIAVRGRDVAALVMAALLLLGCGIAYVMGLRPAVVADEQGITVRNPMRDVRVPWPSSRKIEGTEALTFLFKEQGGEERKVKAWVHQTSPRARAKAEARQRREAAGAQGAAAAALRNSTPTMYAVQQLNDLAKSHTPKVKASKTAPPAEDAEPGGKITWSRKAVAALAVPGALVAVAALLALVT